MKIHRATLAAILAFCAATTAHADGVYFGVGYADREEFSGGELEVGYRKSFDRFGVSVSPLSGIWHQRDDARYREETFGNGSTACRDTTNGQFADKQNCDPEFEYALLASLDFAFTERFRAGAGVRLSKESSSFVSASVDLTPTIHLGLRGGSGYAAANISFLF